MNHPVCKVLSPGAGYVGQQGLAYQSGLSGATVGSRGLSMNLATLPDGARAKAHLHRGVETGVYVIEGEAEMYFGDRLENRVRCAAGEYVYVPPDTPHLVLNRSGAPCLAVVAHSAADDQTGIELLPDLDPLV